MDYAQLFEVAKRRQKLDSKPSDQPVVEALIVVHLDKFVQIDGVQIKNQA
jgi:hypothetical protein